MLYLPAITHDSYAALEAWFDTTVEALVPNSRLAEIQRQRKMTATWFEPRVITYRSLVRGYYLSVGHYTVPIV